MKRSHNAGSIKTAKNQSHVNGNAKGGESVKPVNGDASKMNGNHVNGTNGAEVTLRGAKTRVNEEGGRTTMVVRLHPGQTNRLSAYVEDQVSKENLNLCQKKHLTSDQDSPSGRSWLAEVQPGDTSSICGLEISFSSVPQDIDIKVIPGDDNLEGDRQTKMKLILYISDFVSDGSEQIVLDENKTRE